MSLIGIYSDVHISHNSSILPLHLNGDDDYTTRLKMCKESIIWAYEEFKKRNVDAIVNCGDLYNSHTISADELNTYVSIINSLRNCNLKTSCLNITIPGNHDKFNNKFNSLHMLQLTNDNILIDDYFYFEVNNYDCYAIAFYEVEEFVDKILEMLNKYPRKNSKAILFMHGDINGSMLGGNKRIENHIGTDFLTKYFDIVINGHIHCHELIYQKHNKKIYNIGSLTSHSFADSNNHVPSCYIFNTNTGEIEQIRNPNAIVFKSYNINSADDLLKMINDINLNIKHFKVILKIKCSIAMKEEIENAICNINNILRYKFIFTYENTIETHKKLESTNIMSNSTNIKDEFVNFLNNRIDLKGDIKEYINVII